MERISTVDLLVLTSLDELFLVLQALFTFLTKQASLTRRSMVPSLPLLLVFPVLAFALPALSLANIKLSRDKH